MQSGYSRQYGMRGPAAATYQSTTAPPAALPNSEMAAPVTAEPNSVIEKQNEFKMDLDAKIEEYRK